MVQFNEVYSQNAFNAAVAATASETITDTIGNRRQFGPFNKLIIKNRDAVAIAIKLDGLSTAGHLFEMAAGDTLILSQEEGDPEFSFIVQTNLHATTAQTANAILFRWAKIIKVGD